MTRTYRITYAEHLQNSKEGPEKVDTWNQRSQDIAVEDGWAEDAIAKLKMVDTGVDSTLVAERRVLEVKLVSEAL